MTTATFNLLLNSALSSHDLILVSKDVSLLERCPHFRGWYVQASMELGPEDVSLLCPQLIQLPSLSHSLPLSFFPYLFRPTHTRVKQLLIKNQNLPNHPPKTEQLPNHLLKRKKLPNRLLKKKKLPKHLPKEQHLPNQRKEHPVKKVIVYVHVCVSSFNCFSLFLGTSDNETTTGMCMACRTEESVLISDVS